MKANANAMAERLIELGYSFVTGGTDTTWCFLTSGTRSLPVPGREDFRHHHREQKRGVRRSLCTTPGGIRLGAPALTSRGFKEADFVKVADFHKATSLRSRFRQRVARCQGFCKALDGNEEVKALEADVHALLEHPDAGPCAAGCTEQAL